MGDKGKLKNKSVEIKRATRLTGGKEKMTVSQPLSHANLRVALAQMNFVVGDFQHNADRIEECIGQAIRCGADLVLFPELALTGYPPEDLLLKNDFIEKNYETLKELASSVEGIVAVIGCVEKVKMNLYNSAALICGGKIIGSYRKMILPNYGVFDEKRYFIEGSKPSCFVLNGVKIGLTICEDIWEEDGPGKRVCREGRADVLLNISSSPYFKGRGKVREELVRKRARQYQAHVVYTNLVGGQDELVFDGQSLVVAPDGTFIAKGNSFKEEIIYADLKIHLKSEKKIKKHLLSPSIKVYRIPTFTSSDHSKPNIIKRKIHKLGSTEEVFHALVLGTRDYMKKNGFDKAAIGLSGGIDSALTAAIAVEAIGPKNVMGVTMPSPYSSKGSIDDSKTLALNLGIRIISLPIEGAMQAYDQILSKIFKGLPSDITEENLQARIRGNLMMALSNKMGWLVLTTGNKSEFSVGYCTLYGDMAGGFAIIKDVPKLWVYQLSRWINKNAVCELIPETILTKEPSAELRPDQKDIDSLPPYSLLDKVLARYVEEDQSIEELKGMGLSAKGVKQIVSMVDTSEYKRRQGPPGIKITPKAFGKDRRLPITNCYKP